MISVVLATRNGSRWLDRALKSVLSQTEGSIEVIIVNDASTDNTGQKAAEWARKDSRIRVIELTQNVGPGKARDRGIREAKGDYIALIDDDDFWISKDKLTLQKKYLDEHKDCVLVGTHKTQLVDENEKILKYYFNPETDTDIRKSILVKNKFITSSVLFRKDTYIKVGGFASLYLAEDYDLWLRMGLIGTFANITGADTAYTVRKSSASKKRKHELYRSILSIVWKNKNKYPNTLLGLSYAVGRVLLPL